MAPFRRALALALTALAMGCGGGGTPAPVTPKEQVSIGQSDVPPAKLDLDGIIAAVVKVRGLEQKRPIPFRVVSDEEFVAHARAQIERRRKRGASGQLGASDPAYLLAYYDIVEKVVFLRERTPDWARAMDIRTLVAHEVEHALQDQHFDLAKLLAGAEVDIARAHLALIEGDAEATALGVEALFAGLPPKRAIVRSTVATKDLSSDLLVAGGMVDPRVGRLKAHEREELIFPYREGASFVGAVVRTGGFALVDRVFRNPPSSTAEIYHPEVYVEGRGRAEVSKLDAPAGLTAVEPQGAAGEFGLRNVLVRVGLDPILARDLAATWRGDRIVQLTNEAGRSAYAWSIVCVDEASAATLQKHLDGRDRVAVRARNIVGFTEGVTEPEAHTLAFQMTSLARPPPRPAPPFELRAIAPAPAPLEASLSFASDVRGGVYRQPTVGLAFPLPREMALRTTKRASGIVDVFAGRGSALVLSVGDSRPTPQILRVLENSVLFGFKKQGEAGPKEHVAMTTGLGRIDELRVQFPSTGSRVRVAIVPICKSEATLTLTALLHDEAENRRFAPWIDRILATLSPSTIEASAFCRAIFEERTTDLP